MKNRSEHSHPSNWPTSVGAVDPLLCPLYPDVRVPDWFPFPIHVDRTWIPPSLRDYERSWFWNLLFASLRADPQGYLSPSSPLHVLAGALTRERWDASSSAVLAAFGTCEVEGVQMLCFPPLIEVLREQQRKILRKRGSSEAFTGAHKRVREPASLSLSGVEFQKQRTADATNPENEDCKRHKRTESTIERALARRRTEVARFD